MSNRIKHNFVNWQTGMQVSVNHFLDLENAIIDRLRDSRALLLTSNNFGLLADGSSSTNTNGFELITTRATDTNLKFELTHCKAVTRGGGRIEISPETHENALSVQSGDIKFTTSAVYYVVVGIQPFKRTLIGQPDPDEPFKRHPYTISTSHLKIIGENEINAADFHSNYIPLCRLNYNGHTLNQDETFIPPCVNLKAHTRLVELHTKLSQDLLEVFENALAVIKIVNNQHSEHDVKSQGDDYELANSFAEMCKSLSQGLAGIITPFRQIMIEEAPIHSISALAELAYRVQGFVNSLTDLEGQKMFDYIKKIVNLGRGEFQEATGELIFNKYDHLDAAASFQVVNSFMETIKSLLSKLIQLDYIGEKKKKPTMYRKEQETEKEIKDKHTKKSFSFVKD